MSSLVEMSFLLEGFRQLNARFEIRRWQNDHLAYTKLIAKWQGLQILKAHIERQTAPDYNIFYVLKNMAASEVKLHSPFLADLLDVHGQHCQGDLFYREFLKVLNLPEDIFLPADLNWFSVQTEAASGTGGIDILITYRKEGQYFALAIENKIYAGDQEKQLERYHNYLVQEYDQNFRLIYLTLDGRKPSHFSACAEFQAQNDIPCLSYRYHIRQLLDATIPHIKPSHVRATVEQYRHVFLSL